MKKLLAIAVSALLLTAFLPVQGIAEDMTKNIEIIENKDKTILRAGNLEYELHTSTNPQDIESVTLNGVIDRTVESIELPASVNGYPVRYVHTDNDPDFFWHCENLKEIRVDPENADLKSIDGVLFNKSGSILYAYPPMKEGDYVIPDGTRYIWDHAFYKAQKLGVVTVPDSVVDISGAAFAESSVTDFVGALPLVHGTAVRNCKHLRSLCIRTPLDGAVANAWLTGLSSLESLTFSPDVIVLENLGLIDCPLLKHVEFPQVNPSSKFSDLSIANCDSLETVTLYNSTLSGNHRESFIRNCPKLREITVKQIPYVYSNLPLALEQLPALERVIINELPKSAVAGTSPDNDPVYDPLTVGEECASFAVAGQSANINLQKWCAANQVTFKTIDTQRGDVNLDGDLNIMDVIAVNKFILGIRKLDDAARKQADINNDGTVTSEDSLRILKSVLGISD